MFLISETPCEFKFNPSCSERFRKICRSTRMQKGYGKSRYYPLSIDADRWSFSFLCSNSHTVMLSRELAALNVTFNVTFNVTLRRATRVVSTPCESSDSSVIFKCHRTLFEPNEPITLLVPVFSRIVPCDWRHTNMNNVEYNGAQRLRFAQHESTPVILASKYRNSRNSIHQQRTRASSHHSWKRIYCKKQWKIQLRFIYPTPANIPIKCSKRKRWKPKPTINPSTIKRVYFFSPST